jgi:hypothetical protein
MELFSELALLKTKEMMKTILLSISLAILSLISLNGQKMEFGLFAGANTNFLRVTSKYAIAEQGSPKRVVSYNLGASFNTINQGKLGLTGTIEYLRVQNKTKNGFSMTDINGEDYGSTDQSIINHYLTISSIGIIRFSNGICLGTGLSGNILIKSVLKLKNNNIDNYGPQEIHYGTHFENQYYKRFLLSMPVKIGYIYKRCDFFLRLNIGLMNRIKPGSFTKEYDNVLMLGFGYRFIKV